MNRINTIRYMGNKSKLLDFIVPEFKKLCHEGNTICDLMAGTNSVSYALRDSFRVITNDVEEYSYVISKSIICNSDNALYIDYLERMKTLYDYNMTYKEYNYFYLNYSDKYFSPKQCLEIDSIRYAIEELNIGKDVYLTALMYAMNNAQSTPGHFAQFLPKGHPRVQSLRKISIWEVFKRKMYELATVKPSKYKNLALNSDYRKILEDDNFVNQVDCFYIDTPYTGEQYSRFYHLLNTIVKYDSPQINFKAGYRKDRFKSNFSLRTKVKEEFNYMIDKIAKNKKNIIMSYSDKGLLTEEELLEIFKIYLYDVKVKYHGYNHSTQGKGNSRVNEILFIAKF